MYDFLSKSHIQIKQNEYNLKQNQLMFVFFINTFKQHFRTWFIINIYNLDEVGEWISKLIADNRLEDFYTSKYWRRLRKEVLEEYKYECQECKKKGFYSKANHVHHVQYVRKHPRLALSKTYIFQGKEYINLIPVCKECHETVCHPERLRHNKKELLTEERW